MPFQLVLSLWFFAPFPLCHSWLTLFFFPPIFTPLPAFLYLLPLLYPFLLPICLLFILAFLIFYVMSSQILAHRTFPCRFTRSAQNFEMYKRHLKILGARRATLSRFHTEDPQMLDSNAKSVDAVATGRPRFEHPWFYYRLFLSWQFLFNFSFIPVMHEHTFLSLDLFSFLYFLCSHFLSIQTRFIILCLFSYFPILQCLTVFSSTILFPFFHTSYQDKRQALI